MTAMGGKGTRTRALAADLLDFRPEGYKHRMLKRLAKLLTGGVKAIQALELAWARAAQGRWSEADDALLNGFELLGLTPPDGRADFQMNLLYLQIRYFRGLRDGVDEGFSTSLNQISSGKVDKQPDIRNYLITYMASLADAFFESGALSDARQEQIQAATKDRRFDCRRVPGYLKSRYPIS